MVALTVDSEQLIAAPLALEPVADASNDELGEWLKTTLKNELALATIERDEDGDLPIPLGGSVVYVRQGAPGSSFVTVLALLLEDFCMTPEVYEAVNAMNIQVPMAKTVVDAERTQIVMSVDLPVIDTLSPEDLMLAIDTVSDAAEYFDTLLQNRFGGATALDA